jgi:hypothetical protein
VSANQQTIQHYSVKSGGHLIDVSCTEGTYDAFGNITKAGSGTFNPSYTFLVSGQSVFTNQFYSIPGVTVIFLFIRSVIENMHIRRTACKSVRYLSFIRQCEQSRSYKPICGE